MKKVLLFLVCVCLFSCQSRDAKISKLIKDEMFKTLYDFESYEPIETSQIDSVFTTIYMDSVVIEQAERILATMDLGNKYMNEVEDHTRTIEIWEDSYSSTGRRKVSKARDELRELVVKLEKTLEIVEEATELIEKESENFVPEFIGWSVTHKFRCKSKGGNFDLGTYKYVFDPKFEKILYTVDVESEDSKRVEKLIKEILEKKEEKK